jgi:hypothetical protein
MREEHFFIKDPIVRFDKGPMGAVREDRNTDRRVVQRANFTQVRKRISGRI